MRTTVGAYLAARLTEILFHLCGIIGLVAAVF